MEIKQVAKISGGQDGAIWNKLLFRFDHLGNCRVYDMAALSYYNGKETDPLAEFTLDKADVLAPHSNAVCFGNEYICEGDEFPLLYTNVYNNYAGKSRPFKGVSCVYRIFRTDGGFSSQLVQIIEVGFTDDAKLWSSSETVGDKRPYGNFTVDREAGLYYGFTMRDAADSTRYFAFDLPKVGDGKLDEEFGVNRVVLSAEDIKEYFDCPYHRFLQGACCEKGKIYSVEGFTDNAENPPALRVISLSEKAQELFVAFGDYGFTIEPEFIDFSDDVCYYGDNVGNIYTITY